MTNGGNDLSLIRKIALIALLVLAGAGGEITPMFGATNPVVETRAECKINASPRDLRILNREYCGICSAKFMQKYPQSVSSFQKESMQSEKTLLILFCWLILGLRISDVYLSPSHVDK